MDDRARKYLSSRDENILLIYGIRKSGKTSYIKNSLKGRKEKILYYEMKNTNGKENFQLFLLFRIIYFVIFANGYGNSILQCVHWIAKLKEQIINNK